MTSEALAGRRLMVLLFDVSSMQPEDVQRAVDSARKYVKEQMGAADLVAVATVGSTLNVLSDFTGERERVDAALGTARLHRGTATAAAGAAPWPPTRRPRPPKRPTTEASELDMFNNDVRLRALRTLAETLSPIEQKKAIVYFSAGMQRSGQDNLVELRAAVNASVRAHVAIYPIDVRGLQAVVPGGDARQASGRGQDMFSGRGMQQQFSQLAASQDTLVSLAGETGGRAFTDSNDFGEAFTRVQRDMSAYYLLGYSSTNPPRTAASAASRCASSATACASRRAPATTPPATSPTPTAAIARPSCRSSCSRTSRRPTCRCWSPAVSSASRRIATTSRSRSRSRVGGNRSRRQGQGDARRARHRP